MDVPFRTYLGQAMEMALRTGLTASRAVVGITLAAWVLIAIDAPWTTLADDVSTPLAAAFIVWGWALWTLTSVALLVPSPLSLTTLRCIAPIAVVAGFAAVAPLALFGALVALIVGYSPLFADTMVQGGAYGEEQRFSLRTPVPQMAPTVIAWAVLVGCLLGGTLLAAAQQYVVGVPLAVVGAVLASRIPRMLHRHARRWLVIVPAGIVIHDHLVLAETIMSPRSKISHITTVDEPGETADFTGGVAGQRLAVQLREADKVVLSKITARILGTTEALHVKAFSISPRRLNAARSAITL